MRLSSRRLNVTRLGVGPAAATRAATRASLGSASSDIELMERLLSCKIHDRANRARLQGVRGGRIDVRARRIAPLAGPETPPAMARPRVQLHVDISLFEHDLFGKPVSTFCGSCSG